MENSPDENELHEDDDPSGLPRKASSDYPLFHTVCHSHGPSTDRKNDKRKLIIASVLCLIFIVAEVVGGILSNSLAIAMDAAHLLTDFAGFLVSLFSIMISTKSRTEAMNFGYHRAEVIGALISILTIWLATGILFYEAIVRLTEMNFSINGTIMLIIAGCGIVVNITLGLVLMFPRKTEESRESISLKSAIIHVLGDLVYSVGVFTASLIIFFKPEYKIADPICTIFFSIIVLITTLRVMKDILQVLMEGSPKQIPFNKIHDVLYSIPNVKKVHNLRLWSLTLDKVALSAHIVVDKDSDYIAVQQNVKDRLSEEFDIYELTLQLENGSEASCSTCS